jgi:cyanophycin synthetase
MSSFSKLHFNAQLLVKELLSRGVVCSQIGDTPIIEATFWDHQELLDGTTNSLMPSVFQVIFDDKSKTKALLQNKGFQVANGKVFEWSNLSDAMNYAQQCTVPLVIKPSVGTHGYQVRMNIDNINEFEDIFYNLSREINYRDILIEEQFSGQEYRMTITRNGFFAVVHRTFPYVIWDGKSSIFELVASINTERVENRKNSLCRIWLDNESERFLKKQGKDSSYIPWVNEMVFVRSNSNVSTWGWCIDVTDQTHPFFREIANNILEVWPWLPYIGIDLMTKNISKKWDYIICELNPDPGLSLHTHPSIWLPRDLPKVIIDLLFPETTQFKNKKYSQKKSPYPERAGVGAL